MLKVVTVPMFNTQNVATIWECRSLRKILPLTFKRNQEMKKKSNFFSRSKQFLQTHDPRTTPY